jgi:hypothetical protein
MMMNTMQSTGCMNRVVRTVSTIPTILVTEYFQKFHVGGVNESIVHVDINERANY